MQPPAGIVAPDSAHVRAGGRSGYGLQMELMPGSVVERYVLQDQLGRGGMATVWRAQHRLLGVQRAIKVLHRGDVRGERRALLEGRVQAALDHPGVLPVLDVLDIDGRVGLVLPLVEGPSLHALLGAHAPTPAEARALLREITIGLAHAHHHGLVHRDLKPGNVLLELSAGRVRPRIADFGLVKEAAPLDGTLTRDGCAIGTPGYAAPEQLSDAARADARADLFSLGVLWVELLTGQRPWAGRSLVEVVEAWREPPRFGRMQPAEVALAEGLLARDATARLPDCAAVLAALDSLEPAGATRDPLDGDGDLFRVAWRLRARPPARRTPPPDRALAVPPTLAPDASITPTVASQGGPHNLPPGRDRFIGRQRDLAAVVTRIAGGERLITLLGMGGAGKTRLALEVARARAADGVGGAWWVELADARDVGGLERAVARALDVPLVGGGPNRLTEALAGHGPALLVLDNLEQIIDVAPATIGRWLDAAPQLQVLATSREPLRLRGEQLIPIGPLDPEAAVELFCDRALAAGADVEPSPEVARVVHLLDCLPLGIELAAARARAVPPARLAERLSGRLDGLRSRSVDLPARHRTLMATIQWSWELLEPWEQAALAQVSIFEGGFSMTAADAVLDLSAWPEAPWPEDALAELVDKSLVRAGVGHRTGQPRFSLLRSVQQFAADRLTESGGHAAAERRHAACFADVGAPAALEALHRHGGARRARCLDEDLDNLVAAVRRATAAGDGATAAAAALAAAEVLHRSGPLALALDLLGAAAAAGPPADRLSALLAQQGAIASLAGHTDAAQDALNRAVTAARDAGDGSGQARALAHRGNHALRRGLLDQAEADYAESLTLGRAASDDRALGVALSNIGILRHWQARLDAAERAFSDALDLHRRIGDRRMEAIVRLNLGNLEGDRGRLGASRAHLEAALSGHREVGNRLAEGVALGALGRLDLLQGRIDSAESRTERALSLQRSTGNLRSEGVLLGLLADVCAAGGRLVSAVSLGEQALRRHEAADNARWIGLQRGALAGFALDAGDLAAAEAHLTIGLAALDAADPAHRPLLQVRLGRLRWLQGDREGAWGAVADLVADALPVGDRLMRAEVLTARAEIARWVGRPDQMAETLVALAATLPGLGLTDRAALSQRAAALGLDPARFTAAW